MKVFLLIGILQFVSMVAAYPLWNPATNRKMTFKRWTLAALVASITTIVLAIAISRSTDKFSFPGGLL
jgi:hypothetical protein